MGSEYLYQLNEHPFGLSWEEWAALWCKWTYSIPKRIHPASDKTGRRCGVNQTNKNVWFLTGTFGNIAPVKRKCSIPSGKAIFFPVLVKEDSFIEDNDLNTEEDLVKRSSNSTDKYLYLSASVDGIKIENLETYRIRSKVFDLNFPKGNVYNDGNVSYDVTAGLTRSVCDGFWVFIKPLEDGIHYIHFEGETKIVENYIQKFVENHEIYRAIRGHVKEEKTFRVEVLYEVVISK
jgi:hypothetical protein